jgi:subtilisin family serine protease
VTVTPGDSPLEAARQRTRDQLQDILDNDADLIVDSETDDLADFNFVCDAQHVLLEDRAAANRLDQYFAGRVAAANDDLVAATPWGVADGAPEDGHALRYRVPSRRNPAKNDLLLTLAELDRDEGREVATPDHFIHVAPKATCCPATEPAETGLTEPWPAVNKNRRSKKGAGVNVVVVDTGWHKPAGSHAWLAGVTGSRENTFDANHRIRPYAGHGTFIAGVIRTIAPACNVHVLSFQVDTKVPGGGVRESDLVRLMDRALRRRKQTHLINLSAGTRTRLNIPPRAFQRWRRTAKATYPDLVVVAAAGNDSSQDSFFPASFDWAVGVGSIDRDGRVSSFSNYGSSVDVYALGRNIVNAFPQGRYFGHERPNIGDERRFTQRLARWSGTSFAAPVVTGLIAEEMSNHQPMWSPRQAREAVLSQGQQGRGPGSKAVSVLLPPYT